MDRSLTGHERILHDDEVIVSKTDLKGHITYCNDVFMKLAGYAERDLLGKPHNIIRHPAMPRCAFKLVWDTLEAGKEIFAYVLNRAKNGDHYWVFAHITPDYDENGKVTGYNSFRRSIDRNVLKTIEPLYAALLAEEARAPDRKAGLQASYDMLLKILADKGVTYDRFVLSL